MINLNLNNNVTISQVKTVKDYNTELVTIDDTKQSKVENSINTKKVKLDQQSIIHLQEYIEVKETKIAITEQHPVEMIKGRDDRLYNWKIWTISNGHKGIQEFKEIVERNKDNQVISAKDWERVELHINGFKWGFEDSIDEKNKATDPIIRHALDLMMIRNQNVQNTLREYLSTKTKAPEETKIEVAPKSTELAIANSEDEDYTTSLLKWIDNCLNQYDKVLNKKYNSAFLQIVELSYSQNLIQLSC